MTDDELADPSPSVLSSRPRRRGVGPFVLVAVTIVAFSVALLVAFALSDPADSVPHERTPADELGIAGTVLSPAWERPSFTLTTTEGEPFDFAKETAGQLTLLFFGYTSCPDVCPVHLSTLTGALETPGMPRPLVVFVGVDPARDTPERMRTYLDQWDTRYIGLVGTPDELLAAQQAAGVAPAVIEPANDDGSYLVGHASQIVAYTPDDLAHVAYPFGVRRQGWVKDLPRLGSIDWSTVES